MISEKTEEGLQRVIGIPGLTMSTINGSIGSGIFILPAIVGLQLGAAGIFCYVFCALMLASIMLCYIEAGSTITRSGGSYAYAEAAFGPFAGYLVNWLYFFGWAGLSSAAVLHILADSLSLLFPIFSEGFARSVLFFVILTVITLINIYGTSIGVLFLKVVTVFKILPLLALIVFGIQYIDLQHLRIGTMPSIQMFGDTALILFFAFAGFETSLNVSGEIKNPQRTIPVSLITAGTFTLAVYILLQVVTQGILGDSLSDFKEAPLAEVAKRISGNTGGVILILAATLSCFGLVCNDIFASPRLLFAGSIDGMFPKQFGKVHKKFATPWFAVLIYASMIFIFCVAGGFRQLAVLASGAVLLIYLAVALSVLKLRMKTQPGEKIFRIPFGPLVPLISIAAIIWLLTSLSRTEVLSTIGFIGLISVFYLFTSSYKRRTKALERGASNGMR
ncbi:APC family permease [Pollutibacter soli]|uniref:APC family permease n=1 Tax=Pollutibacter soli TaxID=3034157 RepID=UPI0030133C80